jgi:alkylated DNA repair dioxygenase AlkB
MLKRITKWRAAAAKRELRAARPQALHPGDANGHIQESDDVSRSLSQDRRNKQRPLPRRDRATSATGSPPKPKQGKRRVRADSATLDLFGASLPDGMKYYPGFLDSEEEQTLLGDVHNLPFKEFEFHGYTGKRRTVSFGWRYHFNGGGLTKTEDMPAFLTELRARAEAFAGNAMGSFQQVLVTEYAPGAGIGWHKDRSVFGDVAGISLLSPCRFRLRRRTGNGFERQHMIAEPRSIYLLRGPSRTEWEHSIPGVESLRYSITFRNVLERSAP